MENFRSSQLINNRYLLQELVGKGGFSEVWKAIDQVTKEIVALKIFNSNEGVDEYQQTTDFQHPHILIPKFIGYHDLETPFLVLPFCDRGTAQALIGKISQKELATLMLHIAGALVFVHNRKTIHNDVKPDNFLISSDLDKIKYYLSDFGISDQRHRYKTQDLAAQKVQQEPRGIIPMPYRAPELTEHEGNLTDRNAVLNTDIWAFGASIYELVSGAPPFGSQGGLAQIMTVKGGKQNADNLLNTWPKDFSSDLLDLIKNCLDYTPWERPDAAKIRDAAKLFLEKGTWTEPSKAKKGIPSQTTKTISYTTDSNKTKTIRFPWQSENNKTVTTTGNPNKNLRTWIILLGLLLVLALLGGVFVASNKYKTLIEQGDALLLQKDTTNALAKYTEASKMSFFAGQALTQKMDSLKLKKAPVPENRVVDTPPINRPDVTPPIVVEEEPIIKKPEEPVVPVKPASASPTVDFSVSDDQVYAGTTVKFDDKTELPSGFRLKNYEWDFGDGVKLKKTKPEAISHTYTKPGKYTVKLCYNNSKICSDKVKTIEVVEGDEAEPVGADEVGVHVVDRSKCPEEKFESGTFSIILRPKRQMTLKTIKVIANTGGTINISLVEGSTTLSKFTKRIAQNPNGSLISISALPYLYPGKTYTIHIQTSGDVQLQNLASCSPSNNTSPHVSLDYADDHYVIFNVKFDYY